MDYETFFQRVAEHRPYPYQTRMANEAWPEMVDVPTGLGKTAAVVCAWLWKRLAGDADTGRRLIYCLPMRALVEQTAAAAQNWCESSAQLFLDRGLVVPAVHVLMGGEVDGSWDVAVAAPAILVGTQDMLLSRALNRGYGMNRYRWPVHFGLLNNDCMWVFDETQSMGVAVETSAQLDGLRAKLGTAGANRSLWMSATLGRKQLATVDHPEPPGGWVTQALEAADLDDAAVQAKTQAAKPVTGAPVTLSAEARAQYPADLAAWVAEIHHRRGGLTLIVVNRVNRAQEIYGALRQSDNLGSESITLIHSRFRAAERARAEAALHAEGDRIVVATQAVEAGIDISAHTLITELAPWPSLVQRFGRCNRYGEHSDAEIWWVSIQEEANGDGALALPYTVDEFKIARGLLEELPDGDGSPRSLATLAYQPQSVVRPILRRRDLLDLFDTTPDLCGNDLDISRFVRDGEDTDLSFFWRPTGEGEPGDDLLGPGRGELCRVPIGGARKFLKTLAAAWKKAPVAERSRRTVYRWQARGGSWEAVRSERSLRPGDVLLLDSESGGYSADLGWTGQISSGPVPRVVEAVPTTVCEGLHTDPESAINRWVELGVHLGHVEQEAQELTGALDLPDGHVDAVIQAGRWHDVGKAHAEFQRRLVEPVASDAEARPPVPDALWAKSNHRKRARLLDRKGFRHELASALAWLAQQHCERALQVDLVAYLIAAHHGKVRMSIRSEPSETPPPEPNRLFARGVWDGDLLPVISRSAGADIGPFVLDLTVMQLGIDSWLERSLGLRDRADLGPFRLALLETLVRVSDWRASRKESIGAYEV